MKSLKPLCILKVAATAAVLCALGTAIAKANVVYTYTGHNFSNTPPSQYHGVYSNLDFVTGSITLSGPLPDNYNASLTPLSFTFTDHIQTITSATPLNGSNPPDTFHFATNATGAITGWEIIVHASIVGAWIETSNVPGLVVDGGGLDGNNDAVFYNTPGTWESASESSTPLPAALPLFATGLGVIGLLARRRKRKAAAIAAMCLMNKVTAGIAVVAVTFCLAPIPVSATTFDNLFVFGDSSVDTGWFRYQTLPNNQPFHDLAAASLADGGRIPDTPYGVGAAQFLAQHFGLTANPADNGAGGTNYAASGAQNNANHISSSAPSTVSQMTSYTSAHGGSADPNALYLVSSGGNDIKYATTLVGAAARQGWVDNAATDLANNIKALQVAGAQHIIVSNGYYAGAAPGPTSLFTRYWTDLFNDLNAKNVTYKLADVQSLEATIFANSGAYGFTSISNVDGPNGTALVNPDPAAIASSWALYGTTALLRSTNAAQTSFWADNEHFAAHAQQLEGNYFSSLVTPLPSTWLMLLTGFLGLGYIAYRGTKKTAAIAAA